MKTKVETKFASLTGHKQTGRRAARRECSDVHEYNLHVIKINLRYGTSDRGGQKGKRPRGKAGLGWDGPRLLRFDGQPQSSSSSIIIIRAMFSLN